MKSKLKHLAVLVFTFGATIQLYSQGYIVPNGIIYVGYSPGTGSEIDVLYNPTSVPPHAFDYTGFFLKAQNIDTFSFSYIINVGVRVFLVAPNNPVSLEAIQTAGYTEMLFPNSYTFDVGSPFYVGVYTGSSIPVNGVYPNPLFGWAQLVNNNGIIELLGGALAYQAGGIYAGTQNMIPAIPEPSVLSLVGLGLLGLGWHLRRAK